MGGHPRFRDDEMSTAGDLRISRLFFDHAKRCHFNKARICDAITNKRGCQRLDAGHTFAAPTTNLARLAQW